MLDKSKRKKLEETKAYLEKQESIIKKHIDVLDKLVGTESLDEMMKIVNENGPYEKYDSARKVEKKIKDTLKEVI